MTNEQLNTYCAGCGVEGIDGSKVLESVILEENINGDGGVTVEWNSLGSSGLGVGSKVGDKYVLMEPYLPSANGDGSYRYSPKFADPIAVLGKTLFYKLVTMSELRYDSSDGRQDYGDEEEAPLYTFNYVGLASTLITALANAATVATGRTITCSVHFDLEENDPLISVAFDGDTIKSAASKIGSACDVAVWYTENTIHFGSPVPYLSGEYYNRFVILGGTKNMTKKIVNTQGEEEYAAVTKRLTIPAGTYTVDGSSVTVYEGSIIGDLGEGVPAMTKLLVFDNIFPKAQMRIDAVHERKCYLLDENGDKIPEGNSYKMYSKWYIKLENIGNGINQTTLDSQIVDGETLKIQFLPFSEGGTYPLSGRDFEVVHFLGNNDIHEEESDDAEGGYTISAEDAATGKWYRIVFNADGSTILPTTSGSGIVPQVGDIVSFINIAVPMACYAKARQELVEAGVATAREYTNAAPVSQTIQDDGTYSEVELGDVIEYGSSSYLVTSIRTNLITGERSITFGTLNQKGRLSSVIDKVEGAQATGGGGTTNEGSKVNSTSAEQWKTLARAGGHTGLVSVNTRMTQMQSELENIASQADASMDIWYGTGQPTTSNAPASNWSADEKEAHLDDIYFDVNREPASTGGRAWKWSKTNDTYSWVEITDMDTLASLEKLADVAGDGVITGGAEKQQLQIEWQQALKDYSELSAYCTSKSLTSESDYTAYITALKDYFCLLDGGTDDNLSDLIKANPETPTWLLSLSTSSVLGDCTWDISDTTLDCYQYDGSTMTPAHYRAIVNAYNAALTALRTLLNIKTEEKVANLQLTKKTVFVTQPTPPYAAGDLWVDPTTRNFKVCISARTSGSFDESDWMLVTGEKLFYSVSDYLVDLVNAWEDPTKGNIGSTQLSMFKVFLGGSQPSETHYIWYDVNTERVYVDGSYQSTVASNLATYGASILEELYDLGITGFTMYTSMPTGGNTPSDKDVVFKRSSFVDKFTNQTVKGGLNIWVYDANIGEWRQMQDGTSGLMENYGDHIVNAVFGVSPDGQTNYAAGLTTQSNFSTQFASATDAATGQTALASIKTLIDKDSQGNYTGKVKVQAKEFVMSPTSGYGGDDNEYDYITIGDISDDTETEGLVEWAIRRDIGLRIWNDEFHDADYVVIESTNKSTPAYTSMVTPEGVSLNGCNDLRFGKIELFAEGFDSTETVSTSDVHNRVAYAKTEMTPYGVASWKFIVRRYEQQGGGWVRTSSYNGVDGAFTADGHTLTIKGGIIVDIS